MLTLQPGMAFGTGEHATTQLCCEELKKRFDGGVYDGTTLLDYGSGSGVLAFAALLYGASDAVGVEIDAEALRISRINAAANGMQGRFEARSCEEEEALDTKYPLVVANILAGTLAQLEPTLAAKTQPGGELVLSGIWGEGQANTVKEAYTAHFENFSERVEDGWYVISATRRGV
jgi:ribosomal protein L11 methyltransferase